MKISYNWLQTYFAENLPRPLELADRITMHSSEVEGLETVGEDTVMDIKVLPDRAHYALSHRGIAYEVAAITGLQRKEEIYNFKFTGTDATITVTNQEPKLCRRYMGCVIEGVTVTESSAQVKKQLEAIGARAINSIVDATNVTMFDVGQPLHAFDADKVQGGIVIRKAVAGEKMILLDGREVELDQTVLVIADDVGPLALAGVKGGKRAEVTNTTTRIFLEAANFDPTTVRRTSTRLNLRNDSSKRFENEITPYLTTIGRSHFLTQLAQINPKAKMGPLVDIYETLPNQQVINTSKIAIEKVLGVPVPTDVFEQLLTRLEITFTKQGEQYHLHIPHERLDITLVADVAEEIGRLYGYNKLPNTSIESIAFIPRVEPMYYVSEVIKNVLQDIGFSEIITQTLGKKGDLEVAYPVAKDRGFLRTTLRQRAEEMLDFNVQYAALLALSAINIFEIGKVFRGEKESLQLVIASRAVVKRKKGEKSGIEQALGALTDALQVEIPIIEQTAELVLIDLDALMAHYTLPADYGESIRLENKVVEYKKISLYPYIVRDIAVFVPSVVTQKELEVIIDTHAGALMIRRDLFDVFTKKMETGEEKTSYAFRLIFQSMERTLTDDEVNACMQKVTEVMNATTGWQVR